MRSRLATPAVAALALAAGLVAAPAQAAPGEQSLAEVLAADAPRFDRDVQDFDVLEAAVVAVLQAKPDSPVGLLADGTTRLTAFLPTDLAFLRLVTDLTGQRPATEEAAFKAVTDTFDIDTIETVLLYHVVPGATVGYGKLRNQGRFVALESAIGKHLRAANRRSFTYIRDADRDATNARIIRRAKNINKGSKQIGHAVTQVLRPLDL